MNEEQAEAGYMTRLREDLRVLHQIFNLILAKRKWWLIPAFVVLAVLSMLMGITGGSTVLPAIYALF